MPNEPLLHKIRSLLRKAESTDSEHEAMACLEKAQQWMMAHAISEEELWANEPDKRPKPIIHTIQIPSNVVGAPWLRVMVSGCAKANRCRTWSIGDESQIAGMENDVLYVEMLFASIRVQMNFALAKGIADAMVFGQKVKTFRSNFIEGYSRRVYSRLEEMKRAQDDAPGKGNELVLVRTKSIDEFLESEGIKITYRTVQSGGKHDHNALRAGVEAGDKADLSGGKNRLVNRRELTR